MAQDLDLSGNRFNWALSIFYIVYLCFEVPSNIILKKVGPRFYIPALVVGFGFVSMCTAFVRTFEQLCGMRALLGVFEGGAMPGIAFFLSSFYKRKELYFRVGIYVSAASMAGAFGGKLSYHCPDRFTWLSKLRTPCHRTYTHSDVGNGCCSD